MADVAAAERPPEIVSPAPAGAYRFPTDAEMAAAVASAMGLEPSDLQDGRRMRRVNSVVQLVQFFHRLARSTGETAGLKKRASIAAAMWPDVDSQQDVKRKRVMWKWEEIAEAAGLLRIRDGRGARALRWELLTDWQRYAGVSRGYSSVGYSPSNGDCEARRRRETRSQRRERRVRPNCRRVGNVTAGNPGSVGRLLAPAPSLFSSPEKCTLGVGLSPYGGQTNRSPTRAGARGVSGLDAIERGPAAPGASPPAAPAPEPLSSARGPDAGAAPDWAKRRYERVAAAEAAFEASFGAPAAGRMIDAVPLCEALERFDRAYAAIAALNGWRPPGEPPPSHGFLVQLMGAELELMEWGERATPPRHLGYFVKPLVAEARRNERRARERRATAGLASRRPPRRG